jgi:hypothetical protein
MTPEDRGRIQLLCGEAIDLAPGERAPFLDKNCGADGAVREAVDRLLSEHDRQGGVLDRPLFCGSLDSPRPEDVWIGRVLNSRYRIERFIARGGMSVVYLARDERLADRRVVVKFLHLWTTQVTGLTSRFRREMEALTVIAHPAVVGVLDTGESADGLPFLVMEYIEGATLRSMMGGGPLPVARVANLIRQIARAVAAAHSRGVLHRDLKPENVMLEQPGTPEERVRLIDFGIARMNEAEADAASRTTQFAGTTAYMAPEQLRGKPAAASDIYSMAVLAYEMLAGERPFSGAGPIEMYERQRAGASLKPLLRQGIPEPAALTIVKQLSFRPDDRAASAIEAGDTVADALLRPERRILPRRHALAVLASGSMAAAAGGFIWSNRLAPLSDAVRMIELPAGAEPLEHGFHARNVIENRVVPNASATRYEALRLITTDQGGYYHPLDAAQITAANRGGWKMTFEAAAEEGLTSASVDFEAGGVRYAVNLIAGKGGPDLVRLLTGFSPAIHGIEMTLPGPPGARRRYVLALPPRSKAAELWVDGAKRMSGYAGLKEYVYGRGPELGVARYRSDRGVGVFWSFAFEAG